MKVAWVIRLSEGGILTHLDHLRRGLKNQYEIVIYGPPALQDWAGDAKFYPVEIVDGIDPLTDLRSIWMLRNLLFKEKPDLIHIHGLKALVLATPAARLSKCKRVLFTAHNCLPKRTFGLKGICFHLGQRYLFRSIHRVISVSDAVKQELAPFIPIDRITTIRNGVSCEEANACSRAESRAAVGIPKQNIAIGVVARLIPEKGITHLLEAALLIQKLHSNISFVIVGDGPARSQLEAYRDRLGLESYVTFLGHRDDVPVLLKGWDLYVLPTLSEGFSVSVLEAMAARLPVVVSDLASMREMVVSGRSGKLVRPKDSPALAAAILQMIKDLPKSRAMGEFNYQRVKSMFGIDSMVVQTGKVYSELLTREYVW